MRLAQTVQTSASQRQPHPGPKAMSTDARKSRRAIEFATQVSQRLHAEAREFGPQSYLKDWRCWSELPKALCEQAALAVLQDLEPCWQFRDVLQYESNDRRFFIGLFRHKPSTMLFHLIPGELLGTPQAPLLVARRPVLREEIGIPSATTPLAPATSLSFIDVMSFADQQPGLVSIPSRDEWLYFANATATTTFYFGNDLDLEHVWCAESEVEPGVQVARSTLPSVSWHESAGKVNAFGLVDVIGLVWEWTTEHQVTETEVQYCAMGGSLALTVDQFHEIPELWLDPNSQSIHGFNSPYYSRIGVRLIRRIQLS